MMFRLHTLVSAALLFAPGTEASSANINKRHDDRRKMLQEFMISQKTSTRRHLDVSRECFQESQAIWEKEQIEWMEPTTLAERCEVSPCDISDIYAEYHSEYKKSCDSLGGQFIEYSVKFTEEAVFPPVPVRKLKAPFFLTITNVPDCVSKTCDVDQVTSFYAGYTFIQYFDEGDAETHYTNENSISEACIEGLAYFSPALDLQFPFDFECDENPCDISTIEPWYYGNFTTGCKELGGKVIDYAVQIDSSARNLENETFYEVTNYPVCMNQTCDETHVASFLQSAMVNFGAPYDGIFFISPTSSAKSTGSIALAASFLTASIAILLFV